MKLVAQSMVPSGPSGYLHISYTAAVLENQCASLLYWVPIGVIALIVLWKVLWDKYIG